MILEGEAVKRFLTLLMLVVLPLTQVHADFLRGQHGMVSSRSQLASEVGRDILEAGGNAVDAAVAVGFALAVTYPSAGNIGGGGFMVLRLADGTVLTQDAREKAPAGATRDMFLDSDGNLDSNLSINSHLSAGVPGTVAGLLDALERHGSMSRQQVMAPAIRLAEQGFVLNEDLASQFNGQLDGFRQYPASLAIFSKDGSPYEAGDLWVQQDLAKTLRLIAEHGRDGFYKGETADLIVAEMEANGGLISHQDLEAYEPVWREPVHGSYRGHDIWSMPPPSSGGVLLIQMLNMMEAFDIGTMGWGSADALHVMIEAQRRAYADRAEFLGDPDFVEVPAQMLVSKQYARQRFNDFDMSKAGDSKLIGAGQWPAESPETTHFSVVDKDGNAVSLTTTLNRSYGNRIVVPGTGMLLNNEMDDFAAKPDTPNSYGLVGRAANEIEPGKRMLSSMTPTIVTRDGELVLVTGSPGGSTIINTVLQVVVNVIDHGMNVQSAVTSPRIHHQWMPEIVRFEIGAVNDEAVEVLRGRGHRGLTGSRFSIGDANTIMLLDGWLEGVSDPRNEGGVAGF